MKTINTRKTKNVKYFFTGILFFALTTLVGVSNAQNTDDLLNLLIEKQVITLDDAAAFRADAAVKQQENPKDKSFKVDLDFRTRTELRNGFRNLRSDTVHAAAAFTNQRARIGITYEQLNKFRSHISLQDVRVWGSIDPRSLAGTVQVFEAYVEPYITPNWSIKLGRQKLAFDNQRLFAENDWRVNGGAHDAANLRYNSNKLTSDFAIAFNQNSEANYGTDFINFANPTYKSLVVNYIKYKVTDNWTLSLINSIDGYQDPSGKRKEKLYQRFTDGGRIEFEKSGFYATIAAYSQTGVNKKGANINAYYYQPELRYAIVNNFTVRLGAEVFSGTNNELKPGHDYSFDGLYGVNHRFNGSLEYFTSKPADLGNGGLINPYLFFIKNIGKKIELRADFHLFQSQNNVVYKDKVAAPTTKDPKATKTISVTADKYIGFENDWLLTYKPNAATKIDLGYSFGKFTKTAEILRSLDASKPVGSSSLIPYWFYVSVSFKPQLFKSVF